MLDRRDVAEARAFCEGLIPAIGHPRARTGRDPATSPEVSPGVAWPRWIDQDRFDRADVDGYGFHFVDPSRLIYGLEYDSRSGRWYDWD